MASSFLPIYAGFKITQIICDPKTSMFQLLSERGPVATLRKSEFKMQPQLKHVKAKNGKHRRASTTVHSNSYTTKNITITSGAGSPFSPAISAKAAQLLAQSMRALSFTGRWPIPTTWEEETRALPREGVRAGEIIAWRCWKIKTIPVEPAHAATMSLPQFVEFIEYPYSLRLTSVHRNDTWPPHEPVTGDTNKWGVFSWKTQHLAHRYIFEYFSARDRDLFRDYLVLGTVEIWGDVVEHEFGYRSEFAQVRSIDCLITGPSSAFAEIKKIYLEK